MNISKSFNIYLCRCERTFTHVLYTHKHKQNNIAENIQNSFLSCLKIADSSTHFQIISLFLCLISVFSLRGSHKAINDLYELYNWNLYLLFKHNIKFHVLVDTLKPQFRAQYLDWMSCWCLAISGYNHVETLVAKPLMLE